MNLRSFDLNLLVILDALLDEAHVSRAADRVGLSQPAASAALQRCRLLFRDRLLERGRGTMHLTRRAEALRAPLKSLLAEVHRLVDPPEVPLAEIRQTLRLAMADHPAGLVLPSLQLALARSAPGIDLVVQPWRGAEAARMALIDGDTDIAVSTFPPMEDELHRTELLHEHYVVVMRSGHPAARRFSLRSWVQFPHILVSGRGERRGPVDTALAERGLARRVGLVVPSFQLVPPLLAASDMIATLPSRCVPNGPGFATFPPPVPVEGFGLHLAWHRRRHGDTALQHVAGLLRQILS
ncbi:LysR family transcriptional regulator [Roseomonas eburnea]|uniref:LysR family transcriptional regulator n=1 Tax=Neoroseomonas eburnea TaxID=1346889 RepID=A0A9X9XDV2_9PROT|nr:LysR family transcriptional regulator [Neoroseomonas eburnea]MBR0681888.1 LysR family transcriptional regulator [Neoroseomonas eburnea]